jgi:succinate dehydrogenase hydrophobic anchor subunit
MPGTAEEKTDKIGAVALVLPVITAFIGALLVGIGTVKKDKLEALKKSLIHAFIFGFLWTALFHLFITLSFIMPVLYVYAGLKLEL